MTVAPDPIIWWTPRNLLSTRETTIFVSDYRQTRNDHKISLTQTLCPLTSMLIVKGLPSTKKNHPQTFLTDEEVLDIAWLTHYTRVIG